MMSAMSDRTLVTGFLAFEGFDVNPSALLAEQSGRRFELIEVAYQAADEFVARLDPSTFDRWLILGVAGKSTRLRTENLARNVVGQRPDVRGIVLGPGKIDPAGPDTLPGTLFRSPIFATETSTRQPSNDAGKYLCNYIYFRALRRFEGMNKSIGFLHVPPLEQMPLDTQLRTVREILEQVEQTPTSETVVRS